MKKLTLIAEIKNCFSLFVLFSMDRTLVHVYSYAVVMVRGARKGTIMPGSGFCCIPFLLFCLFD